ncbi:MAG TPA: type III-B CRISPR module-associated protein Cmr5, partial [Ktedonobacteraceae bacterium]|nr:type III-B CRISPR module-associated protein Cmr5 [Ktedonobacteraceae bacterium]
YATAVYEQAQQVKKDFAKDYRKYGVMCHKLPILIHTAGLAQALAFVASRREPVYDRLLKDLEKTLKLEKDLPERTRKADLNDYMRLTSQVMAALVWYKRFAQSVLRVDVSDTDEQEA